MASTPAHERVQSGSVVGVHGGHPVLQLVAAQAAQHGREGAGVTPNVMCAGLAARIASNWRWSSGSMVAGSVRILAATRRAEGGLPAGSGMPTAVRKGIQVVQHELDAATVSRDPDLGEQVGGAGAGRA
jgi:hypothetical protein